MSIFLGQNSGIKTYNSRKNITFSGNGLAHNIKNILTQEPLNMVGSVFASPMVIDGFNASSSQGVKASLVSVVYGLMSKVFIDGFRATSLVSKDKALREAEVLLKKYKSSKNSIGIIKAGLKYQDAYSAFLDKLSPFNIGKSKLRKHAIEVLEDATGKRGGWNI